VPRATSDRKLSKPNARRSQNTDTVLDVLRTHGPSSQANIARKAGLSAATVNTIIRQLQDAGIVEMKPINGREGVITLTTGSGTFVVVEIGNERMQGIAYSFESQTTATQSEEGHSDPASLGSLLEVLAGKYGKKVSQLDGIVLAFQAPLETITHSIAKWCNLRMPGWANVDLQEYVAREFPGQTVLVENDSNLAALAEWTWGAGRGCDDFLYVRTAEGVGGGIIIGGNIYHGGNGMAGDLGHVALEGSGEVCYCGSRGCLTQLISRGKLLEAVRDLPGKRTTIEEVISAAGNGDAASARVLSEAGNYLGRALSNVAKILAPSVVAIGGDLGMASDFVFGSLFSSIEVSNIRAGSALINIVPGQIGGHVAKLGGLAAILSRKGKGVSELPEWIQSTAF